MVTEWLCMLHGMMVLVCKLDKKMKYEGRKVCLVVVNCTAQSQPRGLTHIELIFLLPNTTAKSQPCDQGIIHCLKVYYRKKLMERIICAIDAGKRLEDVQINVLDVLRIIQDAWCHVSSDTIRNCFQHCGFFSEVNPHSPEEPLEQK
jgi:hypothetical protein